MRQVSRYRWDLVNPAGVVLLSDIYLANRFKADEWMKCYMSSWPTYAFRVEAKDEKE